MKDLHACAIAIDKDERITVLHVHPHLIRDNATQGIKALSHIRRVRIQKESVGVIKAEHRYLFIISN